MNKFRPGDKVRILSYQELKSIPENLLPVWIDLDKEKELIEEISIISNIFTIKSNGGEIWKDFYIFKETGDNTQYYWWGGFLRPIFIKNIF